MNTRAWDKEKKYVATVVIPHRLQELNLAKSVIAYATRDQIRLLQKIEVAASSVAPAPSTDERSARNDGTD